jgi:hypothetical protein
MQMEHAYGVASWGAAAFWLFIAAAAVAGIWERIRRNAEKHETLRRIIEKTGTVDEAKLKELFNSPTDSDSSVPGEIYRGLRIAGTIVTCIAAGLAVFFFAIGYSAALPRTVYIIGLASSGIVAMLGIGLFLSSRFAEPPPIQGSGSAAR